MQRWDGVLLTWQAVSGASGYEISRSTTACAPPLDTTLASTTY